MVVRTRLIFANRSIQIENTSYVCIFFFFFSTTFITNCRKRGYIYIYSSGNVIWETEKKVDDSFNGDPCSFIFIAMNENSVSCRFDRPTVPVDSRVRFSRKKKCNLNPSQGKQPLIKKKKQTENVSCEFKFISTICLIMYNTSNSRTIDGAVFFFDLCFYSDTDHSYSKRMKQKITRLKK